MKKEKEKHTQQVKTSCINLRGSTLVPKNSLPTQSSNPVQGICANCTAHMAHGASLQCAPCSDGCVAIQCRATPRPSSSGQQHAAAQQGLSSSPTASKHVHALLLGQRQWLPATIRGSRRGKTSGWSWVVFGYLANKGGWWCCCALLVRMVVVLCFACGSLNLQEALLIQHALHCDLTNHN